MRTKLLLAVAIATAATVAFSGSAAAAPVEKTDGFVCPVFNPDSAVGMHNPNAVEIGGGDYTIPGPNVSVPTHATNGNGTGTPGGSHAQPGDSDYSAIWAGN